jgi:hypothetical protein
MSFVVNKYNVDLDQQSPERPGPGPVEVSSPVHSDGKPVSDVTATITTATNMKRDIATRNEQGKEKEKEKREEEATSKEPPRDVHSIEVESEDDDYDIFPAI